jgi:nucleoside-diphosphate-sugar epimerase
MQTKKNVLVIGSNGQIGTELTEQLRSIYGQDHVIASDVRSSQSELSKGPYEVLDVLNREKIHYVIQKYKVSEVYLLAAMLSATGEKFPFRAWDLNMNGLFNLLELSKEKHIDKLYWPSSIAVFGPNTPKINTPQETIAEPTTVYGISKQAGERWCEYYHNKYKIDVRSLRYPGLIGYKSAPGGGTTDYAVDIFHQAIEHGHYTCFLKRDTRLPMMYMPDAIAATINIMQAPANEIKIRSSYNLAAFSFTPEELSNEIKKHIPGFAIKYEPDFRQQIADSWPQVIDDRIARQHWNWKNKYSMPEMVSDMITQLSKNKAKISI